MAMTKQPALFRRDGGAYGTPYDRHRVTQGRGGVRVVVGKYTAWFYGAGMRSVLEMLKVRRLYDMKRRCWSCPATEALRVCGYLENVERRTVTVEECAS